MADIALPPASPHDAEVQAVALKLIEAFAFRETAAVLQTRVREIDQSRQSHLERVFLDWCGPPADQRPDFLTFAHHRRVPSLNRWE